MTCIRYYLQGHQKISKAFDFSIYLFVFFPSLVLRSFNHFPDSGFRIASSYLLAIFDSKVYGSERHQRAYHKTGDFQLEF